MALETWMTATFSLPGAEKWAVAFEQRTPV